MQFEKGSQGYVFPTVVFYSEISSISNYQNLQELLSRVFLKLLMINVVVTYNGSLKDIHLITDLFPNLVLCAFFGETIKEFQDFKIENYRFSLLAKGYTLLQWEWLIVPMPYPYTIPTNTPGKTITLKKQKCSIALDAYVKKIYSRSLLQASSLLERFVLVYQIIELLMKQQFSIDVDLNIILLKKSKISKNTFREKLGEATKEKSLIANVLEGACIKESDHSQFFESYKLLINALEIEPETDFRFAFYHFRNLIVHEYWKIHEKEELFRETMLGFEKIVEDILFKYDDLSFVQNIQIVIVSTVDEIKGELGNVSKTE